MQGRRLTFELDVDWFQPLHFQRQSFSRHFYELVDNLLADGDIYFVWLRWRDAELLWNAADSERTQGELSPMEGMEGVKCSCSLEKRDFCACVLLVSFLFGSLTASLTFPLQRGGETEFSYATFLTDPCKRVFLYLDAMTISSYPLLRYSPEQEDLEEGELDFRTIFIVPLELFLSRSLSPPAPFCSALV